MKNKDKDNIAYLLYGEFDEKLGYISKLGISFTESKEIVSELTKEYSLGYLSFLNYNKKIENLINDKMLSINWNEFNFSKITKFNIEDNLGVAGGYIFRIFRLIYKEHIWCSHITDDDSRTTMLKKAKINVLSYRGHCKNILDSLKKLFFKYYSGSIDSTNIITANDDAFSRFEIISLKNLNILLLKYCISNLWVNITSYVKNFQYTTNKISIIIGKHIYHDPILEFDRFNDSFKTTKIHNFITQLDYSNVKKDFINEWLGEEYYEILDQEFKKSYNFSYSMFHKMLKHLVIMMIWEMKFPPPIGNDYTCKVKFTSITWVKKLGFKDYFINLFQKNGFSDENITELKRFINDNTVKYENLNDLKLIEKNIFNGAFLETDDPYVITILLELLYESYLKNDLMLNIFNLEQKNNMTAKIGTIFEKKYCDYTMKIWKDGKVILNKDLFFINNYPNVNLKDIFNLKIKDKLETDLLFYNKCTDTIYVIELKNKIRKDYTWQDIEMVWELEKEKGWKEKLKKRVTAVKDNIKQLVAYFPSITSATKIRGIIVVSKPVFNTSHFWKDENDNEYFLCLPTSVEFIQSIKNINSEGDFTLKDYKKKFIV